MSSVSTGVGAIYRLITPTVTVDATGGNTEVDGNKTFVTNLPLNYYMDILRVNWFATVKSNTNIDGSAAIISQIQAQICESTSRTKVNLLDPNYISEFFDEVQVLKQTAAAISTLNRNKAYWSHDLGASHWATIATTLNLVHTELPIVGNGLKVDMTAIIEYVLTPLTSSIQQYLATRIQIAGSV